MNMDKLYCIGYIDDELIEKADKYISKKSRNSVSIPDRPPGLSW